MKTIAFEKFKLQVPEKAGENYQVFGDAPKKVKDMVKILQLKATVIPVQTVANMVSQDIGQKVKKIV